MGVGRREHLNGCRGGTPAVTLPAAIADGLRLLATAELRRRELYVFTDCSRGAWDGISPLDVAAAHPDASVLYVDVGAKASQNFALDAVDLASDLVAAGTPLVLYLPSLPRRGQEWVLKPMKGKVVEAVFAKNPERGRQSVRAVLSASQEVGPAVVVGDLQGDVDDGGAGRGGFHSRGGGEEGEGEEGDDGEEQDVTGHG